MAYLYKNLSQIVTLKNVKDKDGRHINESDLCILENASIAFDDNKILWVGTTEEISKEYHSFETFDLSGHILTPEVVDSHTHLVFGGDRADEYSMRLRGADYQEIAKKGGGILSTMKATRSATFDELYQQAYQRVKRLHSYGIGTIEIKSGYGLNRDDELKQIQVAQKLKETFAGLGVNVVITYMAAHAIPPEFQSSSQYLKQIVLPLLDELHQQSAIDCVDIFHEDGYFTTDDVIALFNKCRQYNIPFKSHADEFIDLKGAKLAAEMGAISTDHLLRTGQDGIEALSRSQTVATLLPGTGFFLAKPQANAQSFLTAGCKVAIASDYNPGSCHLDNVILAASIAAPVYKMNLAQLWTAITYNAACAVGKNHQGVLTVSAPPRFSLFKVDRLDQITYSWGRNFAAPLPVNPTA